MDQTVDGEFLISEYPLIYPNVLKVDDKLRLGKQHFEYALRALAISNDESRQIQIDKDAFPNPYELAQISNLIYTDKLGGEAEADDSYGDRLNLPPGWQLLTTAINADPLNGYFGAAFVNIAKRQVVIAHRGSNITNFGSLWTDVFGIVFQNCVARMSSAVTFSESVTKILRDVPAVGLTFTGHSLGGWLAQITCFTSMYLHRKDPLPEHQCRYMNGGLTFVKNNPSQGVHSHTVAFDSPGCRDMLLKLKESYDLRYDSSISLDNLDITTYLSAPNRFNTINVHFGTVYRIFPDLSDLNFLEKRWFLYTLAVHRMYKIVRVFERETGKVGTDDDGQLKVQEVTDWPISGVLRGGEEYDNFFKWAKPFNNYHPNFKDEEFTSKQNISLRYRTKKYDENECSLRIFSPNELQFLQWWFSMKQWWTSMKNVNIDKLQEFSTKHELGDYKNLFKDFTIDNVRYTLRCNDLSFFVNRTKQLFRLFSTELMTAVKEQSAPLSVIKSMFMVVDSGINYDIHFDDNDIIGLQEFLNSESQSVLCVTTPDIEFEKIRTYKLCERIQSDLDPSLFSHEGGKSTANSHRIVVSWQQLLSLDNLLDISGIMRAECKYDLIIIIYPPQRDTKKHRDKDTESNKESKVDLDKLFSVNKRKNNGENHRKIIFITSKPNDLNELISLHENVGKSTSHKYVDSISFSDLSARSQLDLLQKPLISLHGTEYTMSELFKIDKENIDRDVIFLVNQIIDSKVLKSILDPNTKAVQIQHTFMEFYDQEVSYVKIGREVSIERAVDFCLNAKHVLKNFTKRVVFFISGVPVCTNRPEELLKRLHITDEEKKNQIRDALGISIFTSTNEGNVELEFKQFCRDPKYSESAVFWLKINDLNATWQQVCDNSLYITRKFNSETLIKFDIFEKILDNSNPDCYIFSNSSKKALIDMLPIPMDQKKKFANKIIAPGKERLANTEFLKRSHFKNKKGAVHLIRVEKDRNKLIWQKSSGSLDNIRDYTLADSFTIDETKFCKRDNKMVILSGDPAIGKSITLCSLSRQVKSTWVVHKNLKNYKHIMSLPSQMNINDVVEFLMETDSFLPDNTTATLLKACLTQNNAIPVLVIFDGFDEIKKVSLQNKKFTKTDHQMAQERVLRLLEFLNNHTRANIWITTRTMYSKMLENQFSIFATKFQDLGMEEVKEYLKRFWVARLSTELKEYNKREEEILISYLDELFTGAKTIFRKEISTYIGIALQMRMIAEIAQPQAQMFHNSDLNIPFHLEDSFHIKNIFDLYERFIQIKYDIFAKNSTIPSQNEKWRKTLNNDHMNLSFQLLFPEDAKEFLGDKMVRFSKENWGDEKVELNRIGFLRFNMKGEFDFLHHTFAEFFVAELFLSWLSRVQGHSKYPEFLISKILLHSDYKVIRLFLNSHLSLHPMPPNAIKFYGKRFISAWQKERSIFFNRKRQTALHVASGENCGHLVELILSILEANKMRLGSSDCLTSTALVTARDQGKKTALYLASKYKCGESMYVFLEYLKKCNFKIAQQQILLCTLYRKSVVNNDPNIEFLLRSVKKVGYERINLICCSIYSNWDSITKYLTNERRNLFNDFLFSGFYTTIDQYLLMSHDPLDVLSENV